MIEIGGDCCDGYSFVDGEGDASHADSDCDGGSEGTGGGNDSDEGSLDKIRLDNNKHL